MVGKLRKALAFGLALTMLVGAAPISARANNVLPVQSGAKNASAVEEAKEGELLYFVDAGDYNPARRRICRKLLELRDRLKPPISGQTILLILRKAPMAKGIRAGRPVRRKPK